MKSIPLILSLVLLSILSCKDQKQLKSISALETASQFLEQTKTNHFEKAQELLVDDKKNADMLSAYQKRFNQLDKNIQQTISQQAVNILEWNENDNTAFMTYEDPVLQAKERIKLIKQESGWSVDLCDLKNLSK